jgi:hypothetical protein
MPRRKPSPLTGSDDISYFTLDGLLPPESCAAFNTRLLTLALLECRQGKVIVLAEEQFTQAEAKMLQALLDSYPYYCPHEVLHATFYTDGQVTEERVDQSRKRLQAAMEVGHRAWDDEIRPLRNVLYRTRLRLSSFNIDITSIIDTGYILMPLGSKVRG